MKFRIPLTIIFGYSIYKGLDVFQQSKSIDKIVFEQIDMLWLFYILIPLIILLYIAGLIWTWKPYPGGYKCAMAAIIINFVESIYGMLFCLKDPSIIRCAEKAYLSSIGHNNVTREYLHIISSPTAIMIQCVLIIIFSCATIFLTMQLDEGLKKQNLQDTDKNNEDEQPIAEGAV